MGFDEIVNNPDLVLSLGFSSILTRTKPTTTTAAAVKPEQPSSETLEPSLILSLSGEPYDKKVLNDDQNDVLVDLYRQDSVTSSISHVNVKREREIVCEEVEKVNCSGGEEDEDGGGFNGRKKLRLTKAQSAMLEESFKHRNSLNPKQKQELAKELNLRPRQVEVWFQNRRARTKLKQTEVDCEFLKKCCETLTEENKKLQKEVQQLKAMKIANPFYMPPVTGKLTMCPSCERIAGVGVAGEKTSKISFVI